MEEADRIGLEPLLRPVALGVGQPADVMALEQPVERGAREMWDGGLEGAAAIIEWEHRVFAKVTARAASAVKTVERGCFGPIGASRTEERLRHFADGLGIEMVEAG